ncbi:MAG: enhanced serine sensitivity protein SseB [Oscillospiraceae bacterium]|nr:enhanced serine sensitivity protein SseB [Oscillospiraceae bacterium]
MAEPMEPITNPNLVDAMATFKLDIANRDDEQKFREHEIAFLKEAIAAKYLLPALIEKKDEAPDENGQVQARVSFQIMNNPKGERFVPAFTDEVELKKNRKPGERFQVAVMSFMDLYRFMKANEPISGVVINPFGSALCLVRQQIIAIGDRDGQIVVSAPKQAPQAEAPAQTITMTQSNNATESADYARTQQQDMLRQAMAEMEAAKEQNASAEPETNPITDELLGALKGVLKKQKDVKKAYIKADSEHGERFLLIALEAAENSDIEAINSEISTECADYSDLPFDCVAVSSIRAKELVAAEKPFYEKKRFGLF